MASHGSSRAAWGALAALTLAAASGCAAPVRELAVGDCFDSSALAGDGGVVASVSCGEPHDAEVFLIVPVAGAQHDPAALDAVVTDTCEPAYEDYVGTPYWDSAYRLRALTPTEEAWANEENRAVICFVWTGEIGPISESVRDSRE